MIKDVTDGAYIKREGFDPNYVLSGYGQKISRARIMAVVVRIFVSDDGNYAYVVLDDGTSTIRVKAFKDISSINDLKVGDVVDIIGKIREWNDERYMMPEIVRVVDNVNEEMLRKLEIVKQINERKNKKEVVKEAKKQASSFEEVKTISSEKIDEEEIGGIIESEIEEEKKEEIETNKEDEKNAREIVLKIIEENDAGQGAEFSLIVEKAGLPENIVENVLEELLGEGTCYEPKPGKIKVL